VKVLKQKHLKNRARLAIIALVGLALFSLVSYGIYYYNHQTPITPTTIDKTKNTSPEGAIIDNGIKNQDTQNTTPAGSVSNIQISISTAGQDNHGGPLVIGVIIPSLNSGNCTYTLSKDLIEKTYTSTITLSGTTYICNYSVPFEDLSIGIWELNIKVQDGDKSGVVTQNVTIAD
jgi:hypothetical protein